MKDKRRKMPTQSKFLFGEWSDLHEEVKICFWKRFEWPSLFISHTHFLIPSTGEVYPHDLPTTITR